MRAERKSVSFLSVFIDLSQSIIFLSTPFAALFLFLSLSVRCLLSLLVVPLFLFTTSSPRDPPSTQIKSLLLLPLFILLSHPSADGGGSKVVLLTKSTSSSSCFSSSSSSLEPQISLDYINHTDTEPPNGGRLILS